MKAGYAKINISPQTSLELCGYGYYLNRVSKGIHDPLWARAVSIVNGEVKALIISCDLLGLSQPFAQQLKKELSACIGMSEDGILIASTHTHSGPAVSKLTGCGNRDPLYSEWLMSQLVAVGKMAFEQMFNVESTCWNETSVTGIGFNRVYGDAGPLDPHIRYLMLHRANSPSIILVNYACHPVANGINDMVSADYPAYVMTNLENKGFEPVFITGFCGDIDPPVERGYQLAEKIGNTISDAALNTIDSSQTLNDVQLSFASKPVSLKLVVPSESELIESLAKARDVLVTDLGNAEAAHNISWITDALCDRLNPNHSYTTNTCLQAINLNGVILVGYPGEVFTAFGLSLRESNPNAKILTVNTANGVIGYIPTADEFDREGYASHGAARLYNTYLFHKGFGEELTSYADKLIKQV